MATALYRRYRPEAFSEMIGQAQVTEPLMTALRSGRVGHAYLFSGPRGCGKTTSARILARCLNCAEGPTDAPCGVCESCVELSRDGGGSLDVVEIDAASHGGVEDARDLRERAVFAPARDRYKIFIIDEAHMVTAGGFNALLKIVEEPPPHVKFIFATTEPEKVIGTIRSRTHHYPFRLIAPAALIEYVESLCTSEGVEVEPGVLPLVVRAGGGSVRDTLSILDQLIAGSEESRVTLERAAGLLGYTQGELIDDVVDALAAHDAAAAFIATDRVVQAGQDPRRFVEDLLERLRDLIVVSATTVQGASAIFRGVPDDQLQRMFEQAQQFGRGELPRMADTVSTALDGMVGATAPRLQLELMIARALLVEAGAAVPAEAAPAARATPARQSAVAPAAPSPSTPASTPSAAQASASAPVAAATPAAAPSTPAPNVAQTLQSAREFLREDTAGAAPFGRPVTDVLANVPREPFSVQPVPAPSADAAGGGTPAGAPHQPGAPAAEVPQAASAAASTTASTAEPISASTAASLPEDAVAGSSGTSNNAAASAAPQAADHGVEFSEITDMWAELLGEILEQDRDAWNAVRAVTPLALDGDVLTVGLTSASDLEAFKVQGSGPLRETIQGAFGIRVKYQPRQISTDVAAGFSAGQGGARESDGDAGMPDSPSSDSEEPHPGNDPYDEEPREDATASGSGPRAPGAVAGHSSGAPQPDSAVERASVLEQASALDRVQARLEALSEVVPPATAEDATSAELGTAGLAPSDSALGASAADDSAAEEAGGPAFVRYGEAVVREVLNARFIEERPHPTAPEE